MSIDARVQQVVVHHNGSGELRLIDRPAKPKESSQRAGIAGQSVLFFDSAPADIGLLQGRDIWGGANGIMLGDVKIAEREGYTKVHFIVSSVGNL